MPDATPFKFLFVTAVEARQLKNVQIIGKQDPYLKLWVGRAGTKVQTNVDEDGGSRATWGQSFKFSVEKLDAEEYLYFKVKNRNITSAKTIGSGKTSLKAFGSSMKGQWYKIYDPLGRDAGEVLMEAKVSRRAEKPQATGEHGVNLLSPTTPMAPGVEGTHSSTLQQSPTNQVRQVGERPKVAWFRAAWPY